ncbi:recombination protein RecA [Thermosporothrix hazakensis]|jgi:recombination protein RecA|uniref:Protein RecA n=2 Tax=Thermosporothrix TaxID=768650 RepID=A0A326UT54_THEHA|nr:recombinase RecA [Thermosporothrix hazakensis]PZW35893.1 recombination protein RecA [Thermosporothrix hazakensis]BBH88359.1 protein RecA [Thermosporothrix sp. COM3]GCE46546.1 protein RecA [Thermosporothrix hazakensis]
MSSKKEKALVDRNAAASDAGKTEREKAIELALQQIERRFGKGAIMKMGDAPKIHVDVIPTGSIALDLAIGVGGVPRGRITEIYGPESSGKTTLCQHIIANAQKAGGYAAFIDAEHAFDRTYAARCGVDTQTLLISQPDTGEQALEIVDSLVRSNAVDVIVVDSVAALVPRAEIEGEMGDSHVGLQARLMSQALRKLTAAISNSNCAVIFTNQLRDKIGVMFGNPETTAGGKALKFYASLRLDIRRIDSIKQGQEVTGNRTRVRVLKNKVAPPFKSAEFDIMYSEGISREGGLLDVGLEMGLVKRSGTWFTVGDIRLGQGRENAKEFLRQNSDVAAALEEQIRSNMTIFGNNEEDGVETTEVMETPEEEPLTLEEEGEI